MFYAKVIGSKICKRLDDNVKKLFSHFVECNIYISWTREKWKGWLLNNSTKKSICFLIDKKKLRSFEAQTDFFNCELTRNWSQENTGEQ